MWVKKDVQVKMTVTTRGKAKRVQLLPRMQTHPMQLLIWESCVFTVCKPIFYSKISRN